MKEQSKIERILTMRKNPRFSKRGTLLHMISLIILCGLLPVAAAAQQNAPNVAPRQNAPNANAPTGKFEDIWSEHNMTFNGRKGMIIHVKFNVQNALSKPSQLVAWFQYNDGRSLKGNEAAYQASDGSAMSAKNFTPTYASANFSDFKLFMPYTALNMGDGKAALRFRLSLYDVNAKKHFAYSGFINFNYSK
jgi:hypothetical protein